MFNPSNVKAEIARKGKSIEEVAKGAGLSPSALYKALGPKGNPTIETLQRVSEVLGVNPKVFFDSELHHSVIEVPDDHPPAA